MRLSTEPDREDARSLAVLHAALDADITFFDTADAYCWTDEETGHNERLIAAALATWSGDRSRIVVATKGGLTRPGGRWTPNGRGVHLRTACEASLRALGLPRIPLYQLHAVDPRTPLGTSVRALAALQRDGLVEHVGLCNVTVGQIEEARSICEIASVQVELSVWNDDAVVSGVAGYCLTNGIRLIAHRPLGGPGRARRAGRDATLTSVLSHHQATAQEIALAWLVHNGFAPIPGATRVETTQSIARVPAIQLTDEDRGLLNEHFPLAPKRRHTPPATTATETQGEVVLIMGLPAAGKTTLAQTFVRDGFTRLSRDEQGGSLRGLLPALDDLVAAGRTKIVLDNTYVSRKSRARVVDWASAAGLPIRCVWLDTSIEDAQVNAVSRMLSTYGRLLEPGELREAAKTNVNAIGPGVQFRYQRDLEPPTEAEGFSRIDTVAFARTVDSAFTNRAVIVWCDEAIESRAEALRRCAADGWRVLGVAWRPQIAEGRATVPRVDAEVARLRERLGVAIDVAYCSHGGGPPVCWCRKPLPGLLVAFIRKYRLDPRSCVYVGGGAQDPGFARRVGMEYRSASNFFG